MCKTKHLLPALSSRTFCDIGNFRSQSTDKRVYGLRGCNRKINQNIGKCYFLSNICSKILLQRHHHGKVIEISKKRYSFDKGDCFACGLCSFLTKILIISTLARLKKPTAFVDQTEVVLRGDSDETTFEADNTAASHI